MTPTRARLSAGLSAVACLVATAALVRAAGVADVRVVVAAGRISLQVPLGAGDQAARIAAVAAYAHVLGSQVTERDTRTGVRGETWVETWGQIDGHEIHVWTIADPDVSGTDNGKER
jgi:hypothetical protein